MDNDQRRHGVSNGTLKNAIQESHRYVSKFGSITQSALLCYRGKWETSIGLVGLGTIITIGSN